MYNPEELTQSEIANKNCVERSMVSGTLTEPSNQGIVVINFLYNPPIS